MIIKKTIISSHSVFIPVFQDFTLSDLHIKTRGQKIEQEEMLALCSRKPDACEEESNMLRTFQRSLASVAHAHTQCF